MAIDRTSKFAVTWMIDTPDRRARVKFLVHVVKAVPCRIDPILTDEPVLGVAE